MEFKKHLPEDYSENFNDTLDTHFSLFSVSTLGVVLPVRNKHFFSLPDIYGSTIGIQPVLGSVGVPKRTHHQLPATEVLVPFWGVSGK